jgi:hypothetical protein
VLLCKYHRTCLCIFHIPCNRLIIQHLITQFHNQQIVFCDFIISFDCLTFEKEAGKLSRNVGNQSKLCKISDDQTSHMCYLFNTNELCILPTQCFMGSYVCRFK